MTTCVLFQTHEWNPYVHGQAIRLARRSGGCDFWVLASETPGQPRLAIPPEFQSISIDPVQAHHLFGFALPRGFWWSLDVAMRMARSSLNAMGRGYTHWLRFDADVVSTTDLWDIGEHMRTRALDLLTLPPGSVEGWNFQRSTERMACPPVWAPMMLTALSDAALIRLGEERQAWAETMRINAFPEKPVAAERDWPICEAFIPSTARHFGMLIGGLDKVAGVWDFHAETLFLEEDHRLEKKGQLFHAVVDREGFVRKLPRAVRHGVRAGKNGPGADVLAWLHTSAITAGCRDEYLRVLEVEMKALTERTERTGAGS